jgi:putative ABC transport system ATP-binding protein
MIELREVSKTVTSGTEPLTILHPLTTSIPRGQFVAIVGPSGSGKSTLLGLIAGLEAPSSGSVTIDGEELSAMSERVRARLRRRRLGLVFQSDNLQPFLTALENVGLQLALGGAAGGHERCMELLVELGLGDHADKLPDQLSGGQRQRVSVARALVHRPSVILADEPTGSLDADNAAAIVDLLRGAQRDAGTTLVVVTHDPGVAAAMDRVLTLRDGRLVGDSDRPISQDRGSDGA